MARPAVAPMSRRAAKAAGPHPGTSKPLTLFATACQNPRMRERSALAVLLSLGVLLALSSVVSAALMAPDRGSARLERHVLTYGSDPADLCGEHAGHEHHCPLCHGLPEAPESVRTQREVLLEPHDGWLLRDDLHRAAQARNLCHSPRAPPVSV